MKKKESPKNKLKVGDLLVKEGVITPEQLEQALAVQKNQKVYKPIGQSIARIL